MKFYKDRRIPDVVLVVPEAIPDMRGTFSRTFCEEEMSKNGLIDTYPQSNVSYNKHRGTLRGMHYQEPPFAEAKLITCIKGAVYDVAVDLRHDSDTFRTWTGYYLSDKDNMAALYIPPGFAHGYLTLTDDAMVFYRVSVPYTPKAEKGVMWNDDTFNIEWPIEPIIISDRDSDHPNFDYVGITL